MKKLFTILFVGTVLLGNSLFVKASDTTEEIDLPKAGITPDSKLYKFDRFFEKAWLKFTFSDERYTEKLLVIAEERLAECNDMTEAEKEEYINQLMEQYANNMEKAINKYGNIMSKEKTINNRLEKIQSRLTNTIRLEEKLENKVLSEMDDGTKERISNSHSNANMIISVTTIDEDKFIELRDLGYGNGEILKLIAISEITGIQIDEIISMEIFNEDGNIDFELLAEELGFTLEELRDQIKEYHDLIHEERLLEFKTKKEKMQNRLKELRKKQDELQEKRENIHQKMQDRLNNNQ